jgi:hypothetical protein
MTTKDKDIELAGNGPCPICKTANAYFGFNEVECTNMSCKFFSEKQQKAYFEYEDQIRRKKRLQEEETKRLEEDLCRQLTGYGIPLAIDPPDKSGDPDPDDLDGGIPTYWGFLTNGGSGGGGNGGNNP